MHVPKVGYTSRQCKVYNNVDLENLNIQELKVCDVLGMYDSIYYKTASSIELLNNESMGEVIKIAQLLDIWLCSLCTMSPLLK